jgi:hypothetical protein
VNSEPLEGGDYPAGVEPHRATLILVLGILGLVVCGLFGVAAWLMGSHDLTAMKAGRMDPSGESMTNIGYILGIIATVLNGIVLIAMILFVFYTGM